MDLQAFLQDLKKYGEQNDIPNISEANALYLKKLLQERNIQSLLEIGTANGYSTLQFASILKDQNGHIDTIEFSQLSYEQAQENFEIIGMSPFISQYFGDARDIIPLLEKTYDFIFIDGLKKASLDFFLLTWNKVKIGGIVVIDDVIKFRHKMENFYSYLEEKNIEYKVLQIDPDDGIMIIEKK